ncbi:MAG TPA: Gfo/Idh/MocA family oxidoreductase [Anaerolineae bacterium]|nr:Gfo/Idh/MocA family oxidoreductase [Anaerolineae bacterium]HQK13967.1 Gfo/Idh/MocA family oxidoreductase [Anaerolineae bacterium]
MSEHLKAAVIGVGAMGRNHARVYTEIPQTRLVGVADVNPEMGQQVAAKHGVPAYEDYRELLEREKPDVVTIAVPTRYHLEVAETAMAAGADVLVEKPIAATVEEARALIEVAQTLGRRLMVGHIVRFSPVIQALKEHLAAGELGKIFQMVCRRVGPFPPRVRDVGVVVDLAPHDLDVMRFISGAEPLRVYAETEQRIHTEHEDLMTALLRFDNDMTGLLDINWLTPQKVREVVVLGEQGMFRADDLMQDLFFYENAEVNGSAWSHLSILKGVSEGRMVRYPIRRYEPLRAELEAFTSAVLSNAPMPVSGADGLAALRLALVIVESGKRHQVIEVQA